MAVLAELRAVAVERAAVQAGHEPFDNDAGDELEIRDLREHFGRAGVPDDAQLSTLNSQGSTLRFVWRLSPAVMTES